MTDRPQRERRGARPSFAPVLWGSLALFAVLFALLTYRLSGGNDPSLATGASPRPVVVRKVIKRRIVTTIVPTSGAPATGSGPVTTSSEPVVSSPEPAVAPPEPAPVTTSAS